MDGPEFSDFHSFVALIHSTWIYSSSYVPDVNTMALAHLKGTQGLDTWLDPHRGTQTRQETPPTLID